MVEVSQRCRQKKVKSLAPTHRGVLSVGLYTGDEFRRLQQQDDKRIPKMRNLAQGILPSITYIAQREASSFAAANAAAQGRRAYQSGGVYRGHALTQNKEPDIQANPADSSIDARGNGTYRMPMCNVHLGGPAGSKQHVSCALSSHFVHPRLLLQAVCHGACQYLLSL